MAASRLVILPPAVLALGIALVGWAWWAAPVADAEAPRRAAVVALHVTAAAPSETPRPLAPAATATATAAVTGLVDLLAAPENDLRANVQAALAARSQGGRLYARALLRRCQALAGLTAPEQPLDANDARHQRAVARQAALAAGCSQFAQTEWQALVNIAPGEAAADDPLLAVQHSDLDDAALLQAVFARPDPLLLDELDERLLLRRIGGEATLWFDGQRFTNDTERATAQAALRLLPCHFGLACDERDPEVWLACLRGDRCVASRAEQAPPAAASLAARIADALRARDLTRFMPPR